MDRSYPYTRRVIQRARLRQRAAVLAAAAVAGCAVLYAVLQPSSRYEAPAPVAAPVMLAMAPAAPVPAQPAQPARRVYPYSIVPGGVSGRSELARVVRADKVVAAHYATFDVDRAEEKVVTMPRAVHVSYRKGDQVYWTAKKVMLAEGETLLSDGAHEARARCANRISDTPQFPVEANEPTAEELDSSTVEDAPGGTGSSQSTFALVGGDGALASRSVRLATGSGGAGPRSMGGGGASSAATRALSASAYQAAPDPVRWGGTLSGSASSASGPTDSRPAPGTGAAVPDVEAPGTGSASGGEPGTSIGSPTAPAAPGTPTEPSASLPELVVQADGSPPATTPGTGSPVASPILPGGLSGGGDSNGDGDEPALPSLPVSGGIELPPSKEPGDSPVPEPTLTQPVLPTPAQEDAKPRQVPEPGSLWLAGAALAAMLGQRRRTSRMAR